MGQIKGTTHPNLVKEITSALLSLPDKIVEVLKEKNHMEMLADRLKDAKDIFYLGRSIDYAIAMEGALKLKEISYIHAEAYAAGELKHGTLALITKETPVIAVATAIFRKYGQEEPKSSALDTMMIRNWKSMRQMQSKYQELMKPLRQSFLLFQCSCLHISQVSREETM